MIGFAYKVYEEKNINPCIKVIDEYIEPILERIGYVQRNYGTCPENKVYITYTGNPNCLLYAPRNPNPIFVFNTRSPTNLVNHDEVNLVL